MIVAIDMPRRKNSTSLKVGCSLPPGHATKKFHAAVVCPECKTRQCLVIDSRIAGDGIRRRRQCINGHRFTTREIADIEPDWSGYSI